MTAGLIPERPPLSEVKRKLLEKYAGGQYSRPYAAAPVIDRRPVGEPTPLSIFQEEIWSDAREGGKVASFYNESTTIHRSGDLDREAMERSFTEVLRRHEAWRTTFDTIDGQPIQVIQPIPSKVALPYVDLRKIPESSRRAEALRIATEDARRPFDLEKGPLVRALLISLDERWHSLFVTMHQSVTDGVSVYQILPSELSALYTAFSCGEGSALPELPMQYGDFARWERLALHEGVIAEELAFWRNQLARGVPQLEWPRECPSPSNRNRQGAIQAFTLPKRLCDRLTDFSRRQGVTLFMTLLAAFNMLLSCYTGQEDIVMGTVAPAGRKRLEAGKLLGYFLNPVVLRVDLSGNPTVSDVLRRCREVTSEALSHDNVPLGYLTRQLRPEPPPNRLWPFNVAITLAPPTPALNEGWSQTFMDCDGGWAKWDLYLEFSVRAEGIMGRAQYQTDLFTPVILLRLLKDLEKVLENFTVDCEQRVSALRRLYSK